jgi:hypothetical protein
MSEIANGRKANSFFTGQFTFGNFVSWALILISASVIFGRISGQVEQNTELNRTQDVRITLAFDQISSLREATAANGSKLDYIAAAVTRIEDRALPPATKR